MKKWRIIGVFDDNVKIVRDESLGEYSWDYTPGYECDNNWHNSTLMTPLNKGYYNNGNGLNYYNDSDTPITINFKSTNKGIKNATTQRMISANKWYLGYGIVDMYLFDPLEYQPSVNNVYKSERNTSIDNIGENTTGTWYGKIALLYSSDYGYAVDLSKCSSFNTKLSRCSGTNWLSNNNELYFISPANVIPQTVCATASNGDVQHSLSNDNTIGVYPTLYLNSELSFKNIGNGSEGNPYQLDV